jgi:hypothetical protein
MDVAVCDLYHIPRWQAHLAPPIDLTKPRPARGRSGLVASAPRARLLAAARPALPQTGIAVYGLWIGSGTYLSHGF